MRTLNATLQAAMSAGEGIPIARCQISTNYPTTWTSAHTLKYYKMKGNAIEIGVDSSIATAFFNDMEAYEQIFRIVRGVTIGSTEYTIDSPHYFWYRYKFKRNGDLHVIGNAIPNTTNLTVTATNTAKTVITNIFTQHTVQTDALEKWHGWQFEVVPNITVTSFQSFLALLYKKYFATAFARDDGALLFLAPSIRYYKTATTITTPEFYAETYNEGYPKIVSYDQTGTYRETTAGDARKLVGFIHSSVPNADIDKLQTTSNWNIHTESTRPDWRFEEGDFITVTASGMTNLKNVITLEEEYIANASPSWRQVITSKHLLPIDSSTFAEIDKPTQIKDYATLDTQNFNTLLTNRETSVQAALDKLDDHTHDATFSDAEGTPANLSGSSNQDGTSAYPSRRDHAHQGFNDTEGDPANVGASASDGSSAYAARRDHVHKAMDIGARAYHSANQTLTTGVSANLNFNSERYDTDTIHDNSTNNSRLTCKTAGKYLIGANVFFDSNGTGLRLISIILNGSTLIADQRQASAGASYYTGLNLNCIYNLSVNDYIEVQVAQTSGGNLDIVSYGNVSPEFWMQKIG